MNAADLPDDSDSSDEDYVPEGTNAELPSEEESDGDAEDPFPAEEDLDKRNSKRQQKVKKPRKKRKIACEDLLEETPKEEKKLEKQKTDDLWADFKKDTGFKTREERKISSQTSDKETNSTDNSVKSKETETVKIEASKRVKITQVFKFAGEEVKIEKEVSANSPEARLSNIASSSDTSSKRSANKGGLSSILNQLGKKSKINTLEKSKLDWEKFKKDEDIQDELKAYSKSKDGYLERQDFLERADLRRFEIEKEIRSTLRSNRMNNV